MSETSIRRLLLGTGAVATVAGVLGVVRGVDDVRGRPGQRGDRDPDGWLASVDSEFRFFAAWYAAVGTQAIRAARGTQPEGRDVGWIGTAWLASALGRVLSMRARGRPHPLYLVLLTLEVVIGVLLRGHAGRSPTPPPVRRQGARPLGAGPARCRRR